MNFRKQIKRVLPWKELSLYVTCLSEIIHPNLKGCVTLSLDTKMVFDQVERTCLYTVLEQFQTHDEFISSIKFLYSNPTAKTLRN